MQEGPLPPRLVLAGDFRLAGGTLATRIAAYEPVSGAWAALGGGTDDQIRALTTTPNGELIAGGYFRSAGFTSANAVARWDGRVWRGLGPGLNGGVYAATALPNGDVIVGGWFTAAGTVPAYGIACWDGAAWSAMGAGMNGPVEALVTMPNGDVIAGGRFNGAGGVGASYIARWNGAAWSPLGSGMNAPVVALHVLPDGDVVAGGAFTVPGLVGAGIARWDGTTWSAFGAGMGTLPRRGGVSALAALPSGDLLAGGEFLTAGGLVSARLARLTTTCPATVSAQASGCTGPSPVLRADALPWIGSTFRATCSGMGANAVGVGVFGRVVPPVSLRSLHPAGAAGCVLLAGLDAVIPVLPAAGIARVRMTIPDSAALIGLVLRHQVLQMEADPSHALARLTSSDGLTLKPGAF